MNLDPSTVIAIALPSAGAIAWLVRLEARVTRADERHNDLRQDIAEIKSDVRRILNYAGGGSER